GNRREILQVSRIRELVEIDHHRIGLVGDCLADESGSNETRPSRDQIFHVSSYSICPLPNGRGSVQRCRLGTTCTEPPCVSMRTAAATAQFSRSCPPLFVRWGDSVREPSHKSPSLALGPLASSSTPCRAA